MYRRAEKHCDKTTQFDANAIRTAVQNETKQNAIIQKILPSAAEDTIRARNRCYPIYKDD